MQTKASALDQVKDQYLRLTMDDGSQFDFPLSVIAKHRAMSYADEFDGDIEKSLSEDTIPYFLENSYAATDWARNNMNYVEVAQYQIRVKAPNTPDLEEAWVNGDMEVVVVKDRSINGVS